MFYSLPVTIEHDGKKTTANMFYVITPEDGNAYIFTKGVGSESFHWKWIGNDYKGNKTEIDPKLAEDKLNLWEGLPANAFLDTYGFDPYENPRDPKQMRKAHWTEDMDNHKMNLPQSPAVTVYSDGRGVFKVAKGRAGAGVRV